MSSYMSGTSSILHVGDLYQDGMRMGARNWKKMIIIIVLMIIFWPLLNFDDTLMHFPFRANLFYIFPDDTALQRSKCSPGAECRLFIFSHK